MRVGVVVPVKAFGLAKQRLAGSLDDGARAALARWCAERVLAAAAPLVVHVVCDDDEVAAWAASHGAAVIRTRAVGLAPSVTEAFTEIAARGFDQMVVAHGDLPLATQLAHVPLEGAVSIVPDHRYDGTNVLAVPCRLEGQFRFQYGKGSFRRHLREAGRLGAMVRVLPDLDLARDLDTGADLDDPRMEEVQTWLRTNPASRP